jgi:subtilisin family serine protease
MNSTCTIHSHIVFDNCCESMTRFLMVFCLLIASGNAQTAPDSKGWISLRVLPNVQPRTLTYLAEVAEPTEKRIPKPVSAKDLITDTYGYFSVQLFSLLTKYNPAIIRPSDVVTDHVLLPISPKFEYRKKFVLDQPNYYVSSLAATKMGAYGTNARKQIQMLNPKLDLSKPLLGQEIILPYVAEPITFRLKASFSSQARQVLATLNRAQGVFHSEQVEGFKTIPYWPKQLDSTDPTCDQPLITDWWLKSVFGGLNNGTGAKGTSVLAVADSGVPVDDSRFKPVYWINNKESRGTEDEDNDHNGCYHDVIGCSFITYGFPEDDLDLDEEFHHGTHVAGLASGRSLPKPLEGLVATSVRLMILKIANSEGVIEPGRIHEAITYAQEKQAKIVNMSLEGDVAGDTTRNLMKSNPQLLFVVAAGNDKLNLDLEGNAIYPASLGAELANVITVAASDERRQLTCFSNYGVKTVMIAAPGLNMYSTVDVGNQYHSGTSQAAPLVSLAAALLDAAGMHDTSDIKLRLFNTVTFVRSLGVQSEGILNIDKALSLNVDVVELKDGRILKGKIVAPELITVSGVAVRLDSVESIIVDHALQGHDRDRVWILKRGKFDSVDTDLGPLTLSLKLADNGKTIDVERSDVSSITPAWTPD